jgi:L-ascorbate metabolism protein UlaG (beta-lactamase superfamily)
MEIEFYGANCFKITHKKAAIVIDDNLEKLGAKTIAKEDDVVLFTRNDLKSQIKAKLTFDQPGEYEVSNISVTGIAARSHLEDEGGKGATMYKIAADDVKIAAVGHIYPDLSDDQLEALGMVDILLIPVGNTGYTLDATGALKVIKKIEPKLVIPSHYDDKKLKFEVPQQGLDEAIKTLAMEPKETVAKLKVKPAEFGEGTQLVILERQ